MASRRYTVTIKVAWVGQMFPPDQVESSLAGCQQESTEIQELVGSITGTDKNGRLGVLI